MTSTRKGDSCGTDRGEVGTVDGRGGGGGTETDPHFPCDSLARRSARAANVPTAARISVRMSVRVAGWRPRVSKEELVHP